MLCIVVVYYGRPAQRARGLPASPHAQAPLVKQVVRVATQLNHVLLVLVLLVANRAHRFAVLVLLRALFSPTRKFAFPALEHLRNEVRCAVSPSRLVVVVSALRLSLSLPLFALSELLGGELA